MELREAIERRRSIRKYRNEKIVGDVIFEILKEATHAPSGHNRQPWKFKLATKEEQEKIATALYERYKDEKGHSAIHTASIIREVPNLVIVYLDSSDASRDIDLLSIGGMIDEVLLLAEEKGIGTLWIGNTNLVAKEISEITNVDLETISCIGFGYKNQFPKPRPRKDFNDVLINDAEHLNLSKI